MLSVWKVLLTPSWRLWRPYHHLSRRALHFRISNFHRWNSNRHKAWLFPSFWYQACTLHWKWQGGTRKYSKLHLTAEGKKFFIRHWLNMGEWLLRWHNPAKRDSLLTKHTWCRLRDSRNYLFFTWPFIVQREAEHVVICFPKHSHAFVLFSTGCARQHIIFLLMTKLILL